MAEECGFVSMERRTATTDRRAGSNWHRATDQYRTESERRLLDLLSTLNAILVDWNAEIAAGEDDKGRFGSADTDRILADKERLAMAVSTYLTRPA